MKMYDELRRYGDDSSDDYDDESNESYKICHADKDPEKDVERRKRKRRDENDSWGDKDEEWKRCCCCCYRSWRTIGFSVIFLSTIIVASIILGIWIGATYFGDDGKCSCDSSEESRLSSFSKKNLNNLGLSKYDSEGKGCEIETLHPAQSITPSILLTKSTVAPTGGKIPIGSNDSKNNDSYNDDDDFLPINGTVIQNCPVYRTYTSYRRESSHTFPFNDDDRTLLVLWVKIYTPGNAPQPPKTGPFDEPLPPLPGKATITLHTDRDNKFFSEINQSKYYNDLKENEAKISIVLVLQSYTSTNWTIHLDNGDYKKSEIGASNRGNFLLEKVIVDGYQKQYVNVIDEKSSNKNTSVIIEEYCYTCRSVFPGCPRNYCDPKEMKPALEKQLGVPIYSYDECYKASEFVYSN